MSNGVASVSGPLRLMATATSFRRSGFESAMPFFRMSLAVSPALGCVVWPDCPRARQLRPGKDITSKPITIFRIHPPLPRSACGFHLLYQLPIEGPDRHDKCNNAHLQEQKDRRQIRSKRLLGTAASRRSCERVRPATTDGSSTE